MICIIIAYVINSYFITVFLLITIKYTGTECVCSRIGVVNMSFPLSDQPVFGEWFVFVEVQGHTYNKSFEVQKYGMVVGFNCY